MARLREETRADHTATEATELARSLVAGTMTPLAYRAQLSAYRALHAALESALDRASEEDPAVRAVHAWAGRKTPLLDADLRALAGSDGPCELQERSLSLAPLRAATEAMVAFVDTCTSDALLGALYVLEGSALGALVLLPRLERGLGAQGVSAAAFGYYRGRGAGTRAHWTTFSVRMNEALIDPAAVDVAVDAARSTFRHIEALFVALTALPRSPIEASAARR